MNARFGRAGLGAAVMLAVVAIYYVVVELHRPSIVAANDIYAYFLPNILHALNSLAAGGKGLLWNPLQACGEPFLANTVNGLFYPLHLLFLVLEANAAIHVILIVNMTLGAIGMLLLGREIGLGWTASFAAALAYQLGDPMAQLTSWSPMHSGPWVWVPWTLLFVERLLRAPTRRNVVGLALSITLEILPGFILITALTYQLIAFRLAWALVTHRHAPPWRSIVAVAAGLVLGPAIAAVQLLPAAEYAQESFRVLNTGRRVPNWVALPLIPVQESLARLAERRLPIPFSFGLVVLAGVAVLAVRKRPLALFYLLAGIFYAIIGFGAATPLYDLFIKLPPGAATLRVPYRFFWVTGLALAVLAGFAVQRIAADDETATGRRRVAGVAVLVALALGLLIPGGLRWPELITGVVMVIAVLVAAARPALTRVTTWLVIAGLAVNLLSLPLRWPGRLLDSIDVLFSNEPVFTALRDGVTPQGRVFIVPAVTDALSFSLMQKSASVLQLPGFHDYEALLGYRFSRYHMQMWDDFAPAKRTRKGAIQPTPQYRLLDVAAVQYVLSSRSHKENPAARVPGLQPVVIPSTTVEVRSSDTYLPRARYVPRIEVIANPDDILQRLAKGSDDLRQIAFVEQAPVSGFLGETAAPSNGSVRFLLNDPERVELEVQAPARGFLVLADTYFPGWRAGVNDNETSILRGNYMFRLVEVPAGRSRVVFEYRPRSLMLGTLVSCLAFILVAGLWWTGRRRDFAHR